MAKVGLAILLCFHLVCRAHASPGDSARANEEIANELLDFGLELVSIESSHEAYIKGEVKKKHTVILAKVKTTAAAEHGAAYNPWATFKPSCSSFGLESDAHSEPLRVGVIIVGPDGVISDAMYERNVTVGTEEHIHLTISNAEEFDALSDLPPGRKVFVIDSESCSERAIYWNGDRYDLVLSNEDFSDLP